MIISLDSMVADRR